MPNNLSQIVSTFEINQKMGLRRQNKQPTTDLYDRMVILWTCFGHNKDRLTFEILAHTLMYKGPVSWLLRVWVVSALSLGCFGVFCVCVRGGGLFQPIFSPNTKSNCIACELPFRSPIKNQSRTNGPINAHLTIAQV